MRVVQPITTRLENQSLQWFDNVKQIMEINGLKRYYNGLKKKQERKTTLIMKILYLTGNGDERNRMEGD